jgi:hypothetical protein
MRPVISALCAFVASLFPSRWAMQLKILALQPQLTIEFLGRYKSR